MAKKLLESDSGLPHSAFREVVIKLKRWYENRGYYYDPYEDSPEFSGAGEFISKFVNYINQSLEKRTTVRRAKKAKERVRSISKEKNKSLSYSKKKFNSVMFVAAFFYSPKEREAALGDYEENFNANSKRFGKHRAFKILIWDVLISIFYKLKSKIRQIFIKTLKIFGLHEIYKYFIGS